MLPARDRRSPAIDVVPASGVRGLPAVSTRKPITPSKTPPSRRFVPPRSRVIQRTDVSSRRPGPLTVTRKSPPSKSSKKTRVSWKPLGLVVGVVVGTILVWGSWKVATLKPTLVSCVTAQHTYCPDSTEKIVQNLRQVSFWQIPQQQAAVLERLQSQNPELDTVQLQRTWKGTVDVILTYAPPAFPLRLGNEDVVIRQNGTISPQTNTAALPVVQFLNESLWQDGERLNSQMISPLQLQSIGFLHEQLQRFTPKMQRMVIEDINTIRVYPEGKGVILLRATSSEDVRSQLSTLQSFFHSTTMDTEFTELDVRFANVILR